MLCAVTQINVWGHYELPCTTKSSINKDSSEEEQFLVNRIFFWELKVKHVAVSQFLLTYFLWLLEFRCQGCENKFVPLRSSFVKVLWDILMSYESCYSGFTFYRDLRDSGNGC